MAQLLANKSQQVVNHSQVIVLIIDDQKADRIVTRLECEQIFRSLSPNHLIIDEAENIETSLRMLSEKTYNLILLDRDLGQMESGALISGVDYIPKIRELQPHSKIFMLTSESRHAEIISAMKLGATDYFLKSDDEHDMSYRSVMLKRALNQSQEELQKAIEKACGRKSDLYGEFIAKSPAMKMFDQKLKAVAESNRSVLFLGATGLGKGAAARRLNQFRAKFLNQVSRPFVNINIGAMSDELAQSELFGQDAHSFTGSGSKPKQGLLDAARGGDIFMDEVGDASPELQLKLLKVIEEKQFMRVGGRQSIETNARFIFATNKDIKSLVQEGKFREDLYMRMQAFELSIPTLQERGQDLPILIETLLDKLLADFPNKKASISDFPEDLMRHLTRDIIPGNIRGIENDLAQLLAYSETKRDGYLEFKNWKSTLGLTVVLKKQKGKVTFQDLLSNEAELIGAEFPGLKKAREEFERRVIQEALEKTGNTTIAAKHLGIGKSTLSVRMKMLNIKTPREVRNGIRQT